MQCLINSYFTKFFWGEIQCSPVSWYVSYRGLCIVIRIVSWLCWWYTALTHSPQNIRFIRAGAVPEHNPRKEDNSASCCNSRFSNRDGDKEAKPTDCSFKYYILPFAILIQSYFLQHKLYFVHSVVIVHCLSFNSMHNFFFFVINNFFIFIFSQTTQHNIQNKTKQNSRHILNISKFNQKGGREGRTTRTQKLLL